MGQWVVTVAGIAILSVLCDVILPEGQTRKYVKTVFGVVVSLVIISPVVTLFSDGFGDGIFESETVTAQQGYLDNVSAREKQYALRSVELLLGDKGIDVKSAELSVDGDRVVLELSTAYSAKLCAIVEQVVSAYFPNAELVITWGSV